MAKTQIPDDHGLDSERLEGLKKAVEAFVPFARKNHWHTRHGAWDECNDASDCFLHQLAEFRIDGLIEYYDFEGKCCTVDEMDLDIREYPYHIDMERHINHWAVRVGNVVIDWTARQFDRTASFPAIWTSEKRAWRSCE